ncbi:MAG: thioredoxin family protein [Clostridia bacterium]|nr:thioredoxin family protein [Clostridia bacterium]
MNYDLSGKCLIEISGEGCDACLAVLPNCGQVAEDFGLKFVKINIQDCPEVIEKFEITKIPSIVLTDDGKEIAKCAGYQPLEILELWVQAKLGL